jgi:hypothetical protein
MIARLLRNRWPGGTGRPWRQCSTATSRLESFSLLILSTIRGTTIRKDRPDSLRRISNSPRARSPIITSEGGVLLSPCILDASRRIRFSRSCGSRLPGDPLVSLPPVSFDELEDLLHRQTNTIRDVRVSTNRQDARQQRVNELLRRNANGRWEVVLLARHQLLAERPSLVPLAQTRVSRFPSVMYRFVRAMDGGALAGRPIQGSRTDPDPALDPAAPATHARQAVNDLVAPPASARREESSYLSAAREGIRTPSRQPRFRSGVAVPARSVAPICCRCVFFLISSRRAQASRIHLLDTKHLSFFSSLRGERKLRGFTFLTQSTPLDGDPAADRESNQPRHAPALRLSGAARVFGDGDGRPRRRCPAAALATCPPLPSWPVPMMSLSCQQKTESRAAL